MNRLNWSACCACWLLVACKAHVAYSVRNSFPGVYVKQSESDYSKAYDTLRISVYDETGNTYLILQHTGYQLIKDGKLQPKLYKSGKEIAVYDETTHLLQGMDSGKLLVFSPENQTLLVGSSEYKKIK
jgi:hypothetical protein